jgi:hypothetical protein
MTSNEHHRDRTAGRGLAPVRSLVPPRDPIPASVLSVRLRRHRQEHNARVCDRRAGAPARQCRVRHLHNEGRTGASAQWTARENDPPGQFIAPSSPPSAHQQAREALAELQSARPADMPAELWRRRIRDLECRLADIRSVKFAINDESSVRDAALVVLDEVSMVNEEMADDILAFGRPVLVIGDPRTAATSTGRQWSRRSSDWRQWRAMESAPRSGRPWTNCR